MAAERVRDRIATEQILSWAALLAVLLGAALVRLRLLEVPLDRDEGEFAYMGQLILRGQIPYVAAQNMKLPGAYYAFAAILGALGESTAAIRLGLLAVNLATIALVARLGRRLADEATGLVAAAAYAVLSLGPAVLGFAAKAEHFAALLAVGGALLLAGRDAAAATGVARAAAAGLLFGAAVVVKQHAAAFVAFGGTELLRRALRRDGTGGRQRAWVALAAFSLAAVAPYAATCAAMWEAGAFRPFWFWTFTYAREYATMIPAGEALQRLWIEVSRMLASAPALWLLVAAGVTAPLWDAAARRRAGFLALFSLFSALAVSAGLRFSSHYFILALPAASLWAGVAVAALARRAAALGSRAASAVRIGLPVVAVALSLASERRILFELPAFDVARAVYGTNPFPEAVDVARYIREHSGPDDAIAVLGSEPEIYFHAGRRAATTYIYAYPLMEPHPFAEQMQKEMIAQIEAARPRYLVLVNVDTSWSMRRDSHDLVLRWSEKLANESYEPVGLVDIIPNGPTIAWWGKSAAAAEPQSQSRVLVFERRS